jgi:SAM-dependent methyltransferase
MVGFIRLEHEARYGWAAPAVTGREVLDAACGVGYGMQILQEAGAKRVVGVDRAPEAIASARSRLGTSAELVVGDLQQLPFPNGSFDVVVCFEAIEHVDHPEEALDEFKRVLRPDGVLVLSTPNALVYVVDNPHHVHEFVPDELRETLATRFRRVDVYRQHPWVATLITDDRELLLDDPAVDLQAKVRKADRVVPGEELFTLAVAGDAELPELEALTMLGDPVDIRRTGALQRELQLVTQSVSWRITAPLRAANARLRTFARSKPSRDSQRPSSS